MLTSIFILPSQQGSEKLSVCKGLRLLTRYLTEFVFTCILRLHYGFTSSYLGGIRLLRCRISVIFYAIMQCYLYMSLRTSARFFHTESGDGYVNLGFHVQSVFYISHCRNAEISSRKVERFFVLRISAKVSENQNWWEEGMNQPFSSHLSFAIEGIVSEEKNCSARILTGFRGTVCNDSFFCVGLSRTVCSYVRLLLYCGYKRNNQRFR